jgi:hypothetical protein
MDARIALAVMAKAKLVFERDETSFLAFPTLTPYVYSRAELEAVASGEISREAALVQSEFSRVVNAIPRSVVWSGDGARLWEVYDDVLGSVVASSSRTPDEERRYREAFEFLHREVDGRWEDAPEVVAYRAWRDAWFTAQADLRNREVEAQLSGEPQVKARWEADAPAYRARIADVESSWKAQGHKEVVERHRSTEAELGARSPLIEVSHARTLLGDETAMLMDPSANRYLPSGFFPANAIDEGAWQRFTLSGAEARVLVDRAPAELRAQLAPDGLGLEVERLSFEYSSAAIARPWFVPGMLTARYWKFADPGKLLSDGVFPPSPASLCPAYVAAVVFARNVEVTVKRLTADQREAVRRGAVAGGLSLGFMRLVPKDAGTFGGAVLQKKSRLPDALLARRAATLAVRAPSRRVAAIVAGAIDAAVRAGVAPVRPAPPPASAAPAPPDDALHVMAFVCKRLPPAPDPDATLQWT